MKTGIGQSKYGNLTLFHVVWSFPAKVFLTVTFSIWFILTDHDLLDPTLSKIDRTRFFAVFFFKLTKHTKKYSYRIITGSPSSKFKHRRTSTLLHSIRNIRICMEKTYRFRNVRKWKDFNKKQLTLHKLMFMAVLWVVL